MMNRLLAYSPNLKQSWILAGIIVLCLNIIGGVTSIVMTHILPGWADLTGYILSVIIVAWIVICMGKGSNYGPVVSPPQAPRLWLLLVPFTLSFGMVVDPLSMWIPMPDVMQQIFASLVQKNLPAFLLIIVVAPVCEEWLLRGIVLKGLLRHYSPLKAIMWSALMFGMIHLNPWQLIPAFFIGLIIGWVYWRTRSLRLCIFMHATNNAAAFIFSTFLFPDTPVNASVFDQAGGYYIYVAALLVCVLTGMWVKNIISSSGPALVPQNQYKPVSYSSETPPEP